MATGSNRRGGPLIALAAVLGLWVAARLAITAYGALPPVGELPERHAPLAIAEPPASKPVAVPLQSGFTRGESEGRSLDASPAKAHVSFSPPPVTRVAPLSYLPSRPSLTMPAPVSVEAAAGHQILWMAALSRMPLPAGMALQERRAAPVLSPFWPAGSHAQTGNRWSADGWLLLRRGAHGTLGAGAAPATYGASQTGAVLRFRIAPQSPHRPEAYARFAAAVDGPAQKEAAVGLSARPLPAVPLRAMAELRLSDQAGGTRARPAALVVTEIAPIELPHEVRAEFYGQAGYVGGRNATLFADGQARLDTRVAELGPAEVRAGAGVWSGAQKGAARVDAGPSATVGLPLGGGGSARLGLDWRLRVAGEAQPGSGLALTLSAGF